MTTLLVCLAALQKIFLLSDVPINVEVGILNRSHVNVSSVTQLLGQISSKLSQVDMHHRTSVSEQCLEADMNMLSREPRSDLVLHRNLNIADQVVRQGFVAANNVFLLQYQDLIQLLINEVADDMLEGNNLFFSRYLVGINR